MDFLLVGIYAYIQVTSLRGVLLASVVFSACGNEPASKQSCMSPQKLTKISGESHE